MAVETMNFHIQEKMKRTAPHHESFQALWKNKWEAPYSRGEYPFLFASMKDFQRIVEDIIAKGFGEPYDWNEYPRMYFPTAARLVKDAQIAEEAGHRTQASELYLLREFPTSEVMIPHTHRLAGEGEYIPVYHNVSWVTRSSTCVPFVIIITGLDGYRTELAMWVESWGRAGVGALAVEIPGTGDSPAFAQDPRSPDRLWSSLLDWVERQDGVDKSKICAWGLSTGGFYAIRMAHTHHHRLAGVVSHGGGCHYMFDRTWLNEVNHLEYPFDLANALAAKWGYGNDVEAFKDEAMQKFSLLRDGTLDSPNCTRILLVNGMEDEIFPIDDYELCLRHGVPKESRFIEHAKHMAEPESFSIIVRWLLGVMDVKCNPSDVLSNCEFRFKH